MKIESGKLYRCRDGRKARIYAVDGAKSLPVHGAVLHHYGWDQDVWTEAGQASAECLDLISEWVDPPKVVEITREDLARAFEAMGMAYIGNSSFVDQVCKELGLE